MFKYIILASAFCIALVAGFFSISGIGQLFVGATIAATCMAGALEFGKLVAVSFIYRYWHAIHVTLRGYFIGATVILMGITSIGVYGYLSSAYAVGASQIGTIENHMALVMTEQTNATQQLQRLKDRITATQGIRDRQETRLDQLVGKRGLADQQRTVRTVDTQLSTLELGVTALSHTIDSLATEQTRLRISITTTGKIGTFYYIAQSLHTPLDTIVHWFILAIVVVLDPLSITLLLAYNIINKNDILPIPVIQDTLPKLAAVETVEDEPMPLTRDELFIKHNGVSIT